MRALAKIRKALGPLFQQNIWNTKHLYDCMVKPILLYNSDLAKLFLTIINNRLTMFATERNILSSNQLGFVQLNRTSDPHIILNNLVRKYCHKKKKKLFGCFVDFSKAFDSVPRDILIDKLRKHGIDGKVLEIIKTLYTQDKAGVKFGNQFSPPSRRS